ncbi:hypothetical protein DIE12_33425 [Burkholderia sp. Bp9015]|nr:hypothetical protein DIE20_33520 [Burkholderia sp. Bp9131]RQR63678.1 hypothetical protein DIE12_33425 [Burkholderia sp. Bp9015]RQR73523.1 hypothetical protein DIE10_31830 [Burkholderia sp. Bp9011]RQR85213.1 hypothetical protein DIE09_32130 [Burkholderia sp. Bp9010]RQR96481.1 hypothetical protein DIE02_31775 [Burkholderia sp. Bp8991]RQS65896.1 hypothetical protein DID97_31060 [Burkholderia sp. Bp8977]
MEDFVPTDHPMRPILQLVNQALLRFNKPFAKMMVSSAARVSGGCSIACRDLLQDFWRRHQTAKRVILCATALLTT